MIQRLSDCQSSYYAAAKPMRDSSRSLCLLLSLALLASIASLGIGCRGDASNAKAKRTRARISLWRGNAQRSLAAEAAAEWEDLRRTLGTSLEKLPEEEKQLPYRILGGKFYAEGNYAMALTMFDKAGELCRKYRDPIFLAYLAGMAGRKDWLKEELDRGSEKNDRMYENFLRANMAWVDGDYKAVAAYTSPENLRLAPQGDRVKWNICLGFLRTKALFESGEKKRAATSLLDVLNSSGDEEQIEEALAGSDTVFRLEYTWCMTQMAQECGHYDLALIGYEALLKEVLTPFYGSEKSWQLRIRDVKQGIARCKAKLQGTATKPS